MTCPGREVPGRNIHTRTQPTLTDQAREGRDHGGGSTNTPLSPLSFVLTSLGLCSCASALCLALGPKWCPPPRCRQGHVDTVSSKCPGEASEGPGWTLSRQAPCTQVLGCRLKEGQEDLAPGFQEQSPPPPTPRPGSWSVSTCTRVLGLLSQSTRTRGAQAAEMLLSPSSGGWTF